jgi:hypothetical protein
MRGILVCSLAEPFVPVPRRPEFRAPGRDLYLLSLAQWPAYHLPCQRCPGTQCQKRAQ